MTSPVQLDAIMRDLLCQLRNADRRTFEGFIDALDLYAIEVMTAMTAAPQESILNMQGRAQQVQAILKLFRTCHAQKPPTQST